MGLFERRAVLFLLASGPGAMEQPRRSHAELVILDVEDAVKPDDKASARKASLEAVHQG